MGKGFIERSEGKAASPARSLAPLDDATHLVDAASRTKIKLRLWDRIGFDKETSGMLREKLGEIATAMMEKQKSEIVHSLMLDLDEAKKRRFREYLKSIGAVNEDLIRDSNAMEIGLNRTMSREIDQAILLKAEWSDRLKQTRAKGLLNDADYEKEVARMEKWIDITKDNIEGKIELVIRTHIKSLQTTLELLRDKALMTGETL